MKDDFLSRQPYINLLKSIIANQCEKQIGYSFAIDGEWGCGKTWILNELENQLGAESKDKYLIFHYNAWENDFYDEPLVAILSVMIDKLNEVTNQKSIYESAVDELLKETLNDLKILVCGIAKGVTKIDFEKSVNHKKDLFERIKQGTKISQKDIDTYIPLKNTITVVRGNILKISDRFSIILVVDELDRCLPEYAIKVLERLHHICSGMPLIQILAINKRHLADSIAKVFGKDYETHDNQSIWNIQFAESYLQKFFDVIIPLPAGKLDNRLEVMNGLEKEFKPYIRKDSSGRTYITVDDSFLISFITSLMDGIDRRLQEKIFAQVALCHKLTIESDVQYEDKQLTYAILIYEVISCICRYVFHLSNVCQIRHEQNSDYFLEFFINTHSSLGPYQHENLRLNSNLKNCSSVPVEYNHDSNGNRPLQFGIRDTKSFVLAYFSPRPNYSSDTEENHVWDLIKRDSIFLHKYDEIMKMLVAI